MPFHSFQAMGNENSRGASSSRGGSGLEKFGVGKKGPGVKELVERAQKMGVLKLSKMGLKDYPSQLSTLNAILRSLDLSHNRLTSLPSQIGDFTQLKQLHLDSNNLTTLPDEIGRLKKLETLTVNNNELTSLPDTLVGCLALRTLSLSSNHLTTFSYALCHLPTLDAVDASSNRLITLPDDIAVCNALELNLNRNQIANLNGEKLAKAPRLKILRLEENCLPLKALTPVLADSKVSTLALDGNLFQERDLLQTDGYDAYQDRFTQAKKKMY